MSELAVAIEEGFAALQAPLALSHGEHTPPDGDQDVHAPFSEAHVDEVHTRSTRGCARAATARHAAAAAKRNIIFTARGGKVTGNLMRRRKRTLKHLAE